MLISVSPVGLFYLEIYIKNELSENLTNAPLQKKKYEI